MFDPQKADPFFLKVIQNAPAPIVQIVGEALRRLITGGPEGAVGLLNEARPQVPADHPAQKILSSLQVGIEAVRSLKDRDPEAAFEWIWNRRTTADATAAANREITVSRDVQSALLSEVRRQIAERAAKPAHCPCCGAALPAGDAAAPVIALEQEMGHIRLYADIAPLRDIARQDLQNLDIDDKAVIELTSILCKHANITVPAVICPSCATAVIAHPFDPDLVAAFYAGGDTGEGAAAPKRQTADERFVAVYGRSMFPHWLVARTGVKKGTRVFDFGCGKGMMLKHLALFGAEVAGIDLDRYRASYAREVLGLSDVTDAPETYEALPAGSFDLVMSSHALEHVTDMDRHVERLCGLVAPGGHLAVAVPNGELAGRKEPGGAPFYPMLGGDHLTALTPETLGRRVTAAGLQVVEVQRGPADLTDRALGMDRRDPLTGFPVWTEAAGDFALLAKRP